MEAKDILTEAKELYTIALQAHQHQIDASLDDIKFGLLGEQWDEQAKRQRESDGVPCLTLNKIPSHVRQVVNEARQNKPSIRVHPVDDNADPETAEVWTGLIRNIESTSNADVAYDTAITQSVSCGIGYFRVNVDYTHDDTFDQDIVIERILNQFSVIPDHKSTSADGSDWNYCFVHDRIPPEEYKDRFPGAELTDFEKDFDSEKDHINDDGVWIAEYWKRSEVTREVCQLSNKEIVDEEIYKENEELYQALGLQKVAQRTVKSYKVVQYILSGAEVIETVDWSGRYIPIVPVYGEEVVLEGKRYFKSLFRDSKDAQRQYNFWRSTTTQMVGDSTKYPYIAEEKTLVDPEKWANSTVERYAYLEYKKGAARPSKDQFSGVPAGAFQEALNSADDIKSTMGMFDASLGAKSNEVSGVAIANRKNVSDIGSFHFIDNRNRAIRHLGKIIIDLAPSVYTSDRVIRILGEDGKDARIVKIDPNQQQSITEGEGEEGQEQLDESSRIFNLFVGKYDVVVDAGPSYSTKREEADLQMTEMSKAYPQLMQVAGDIIFKNKDWPGADDISERLKKMLPPQLNDKGQDPQMLQMQQQMQQMQQEAMQAVQQLRSELDQIKTDKSIEAEKIKIQAYDSETKRIQAVSTGITPEQLQPMIMQMLMQVLQTPDVTPGSGQQQDPAMFQQMMAQESQQQPYQNIDGQQQPQGMPQ